MTTGEKIKRLRKEQGKTQEELGAAIGVQKAAINKYETGMIVNIKRKTIAKLAHALGVSPVWLMDDTDGWPPTRSASAIIERAFREQRAREEQEEEDEVFAIANLYQSLSKEARLKAKSYLEFLKSQEGTV